MLDNILLEDLQSIIEDTNIEWDKLDGTTILVTGSTGLIGSLIVKTLLHRNIMLNKKIKILAFARYPKKVKKVYGDEQGINFIYGDIQNLPTINDNIEYIIHTASITKSKLMVSNPVETILTSFEGTKNVLELAEKKKLSGMIYISSMEVYGNTDPAKEKITEADLGYIDILNMRSSYPEGKRACECLCASYAKEYDVPVKIIRLAQTFGAGVSDSDNRVFAQFARCSMMNENIVLHTEGNSFGNYCYTADAVRAILTVMTKGKNGEAYTIVNEATTMKIKEMAAMVAREIAGGKITITFDISKDKLKYGYFPDVTTHLSGEKIRQLGWIPKYSLKEMYQRMIKYWENQQTETKEIS